MTRDTIAAIATPPYPGAIGIIRLSGPQALEIADRVFAPAGGGPMAKAPDRQLVYGRLLGQAGETLDLCLCTVSRGPHSYTGEDTAELQCHGSPTVLREGLRQLFAAGARQALPGEFTRRAFLNGKMDLSQAEAVVDLIDAATVDMAKNAAGQLSGAISRRTDQVYEDLRDMMAHFYAVIDYPDEDIEAFQLQENLQTLDKAAGQLEALLRSFDRGQVLREGVAAAIIGKPNTGKSSLLNAILGYDRAIVTPIAGTTRDTIDERAILGGVLLRLTDTAGIRETEDPVEQLGVERSMAAAAAARLVLAVFDGSAPLTEEDQQTLEQACQAPCAIAVVNKMDLGCKIEMDVIEAKLPTVCLSAKTLAGLEELDAAVGRLLGEAPPADWGEILTNQRQAEAAARALESIQAAREAMAAGMTPDAVLTEVETAMSALGEISGRTVREDIVSRIFERFCVGK